MGNARSPGLIVAAIMSIALAGCGANPASTSPSPAAPAAVQHYAGRELSFDYPGSWRAAEFAVVSSFSSVLTYLSTSPLSDPCDRTPGSIACVRSAVAGLGPDGVLVEWTHEGWPGWTFDPTRGRLVEVAGRRATLEELDADDACRRIGGERELLVTIDDPVPDQNWTGMRACLRGPSLDAVQGQVEAMLASVQWKQ